MKNKALAFALEVEAQGTQMYLQLAARTTNAVAKLLFYSLAEKEIDHARRFDTLYAQIIDKKSKLTVPVSKVGALEKELKLFFKTASRTALKKGTIQLAGYQMAMKMEKATYNAYKDFHDIATAETEKKFFAALMKEENEHYTALANVYLYLTDKGDWLQEDESQTWNWMNS